MAYSLHLEVICNLFMSVSFDCLGIVKFFPCCCCHSLNILSLIKIIIISSGLHFWYMINFLNTLISKYIQNILSSVKSLSSNNWIVIFWKDQKLSGLYLETEMDNLIKFDVYYISLIVNKLRQNISSRYWNRLCHIIHKLTQQTKPERIYKCVMHWEWRDWDC